MSRLNAGEESVVPAVARQIRVLREQQNLSQQALAETSGMSRNTLSLLERGKTSPTLDTLQKLADALRVDVGAFFKEVSQSEVAYDKAGAGLNDPISRWPEDQGVYGIDGLISALILRLEPKARCGSLLPHGGQEFIYCLSGQCTFCVDEKIYVLESGDSLRFDGRLPHYCQNNGRETAKALVLFLDFAEALSAGI
jgi:transcriptional regulator with XRE-family HTH domain